MKVTSVRRGLSALFVVLVGCGESPESQPELAPSAAPTGLVVHHDLVRRFDEAELHRETAVLDLGAPKTRTHLVRGWGDDERADEQTFVWGLAESSTLDFFVAEPRNLTLELDARAFAVDGAPSQVMTVSVGDRELGQVEIGDAFDRHEVAVPEEVLKSGLNRLRFGYGTHHRPVDVLPDSQDERPLAVQWDSITFDGLDSEASPRLSTSEDRLEIPTGSQIAFYFELEPGQELMIGDLSTFGRSADLRLRVAVTTAEGTVEKILEPGTAPPVRVPLAVSSRSVGRLSLAAVGGRRGWLASRFSGESGLSMLLPMVMGGEKPALEVAEWSPSPSTVRPDVLLYVIDTLRADHLGVYGYERPTSPAIDRFARDAILFRNARAQSSWTRTAMVSVMTGLLPQVHGVNRRDEALNRRLETLAEILKKSGYETAGFITNGNLSAGFGLDQGFDLYSYLTESRSRFEFHELSDRVNRGVIPWLTEHIAAADRAPFFLYAHTTDPHAPYTPREPFRGRFAAGIDPEVGSIDNVLDISANRRPAPPGIEEDFIDLYDGEIAFNDHHFGRLIERLKSLGLYDSTLIVLLSDHGEEFLEHGGWEHGKTLYGEQLRVPLLVKLPGGVGAGREIEAVADQIDVLPTILEVVGLEPPLGIDGHSLLPLLGSEMGDSGLAFSEPSFAYLKLEEKHLRSVDAGGWKMILDDSVYLRGGAVELYDTVADPLESRELHDLRPLERGFLDQTLQGFENALRSGSRRSTAEQAEVDEALHERLKALGYVN